MPAGVLLAGAASDVATPVEVKLVAVERVGGVPMSFTGRGMPLGTPAYPVAERWMVPFRFDPLLELAGGVARTGCDGCVGLGIL